MCDGMNHGTRIASDCKHEPKTAPRAGREPERSEASTGSPAPRSGDALYFTPSRNTVDEGDEGLIEVETEYECKAVGCRSRFCPECCRHLGLSLREILIPVLETFTAMMMLTLTIDPKLFPSPEHAYRYVRKKRSVAELVRALHKAGHLRSKRFFYVVEWQKNSQMAHFHLLVEASFIPFEVIAALWGRNRPKSAPPVEGNAPAFGHVRFSAPSFVDATHAARYATKYLLKLPEQGYPEWVMKFDGQIRMFATSRGLLPQRQRVEPIGMRPKLHDNARPHDEGCFCAVCRGDEQLQPGEQPPPQRGQTVGERLAKCGQKAAILAVPIYMRPDGEVFEGKKKRHVANVAIGFHEVKAMLNVDGEKLRRFRLRPGECGRLLALAKPGEVARGYVSRVAA